MTLGLLKIGSCNGESFFLKTAAVKDKDYISNNPSSVNPDKKDRFGSSQMAK